MVKSERWMSQDKLDDFRSLLRLRIFEEIVREQRLEGSIVGSVHLGIGQEALPVGTIPVLGPDDAVFVTYRGHGWALACGVPAEAMFAELMGRATGINGGRGGSAYFSAPAYRFYGENSIVGAGAPHAVGAALAGTYDGTDRVALAVFGDGAMNQGAVHEAMNFASARGLPVLFLCENNYWSEMTPIVETVKDAELHKRARAYGMPGRRIDGNDLTEVREAMGEAATAARAGGGPQLIEAMTARIVGHYIGDVEHYRRPGELDAARESEPVVRVRKALLAAGTDLDTISALEAEVRAELEGAASRALEAKPADPTSAREHLYV
jgi:TPP-dependent pyruvate/acetoin dehydrogenase alpha subunit